MSPTEKYSPLSTSIEVSTLVWAPWTWSYFGARSFSIWAVNGRQLFDSGAQLETITAALLPSAFNSNHEEAASFDTRSDNKGPEPEGVDVHKIWGRWYAFVVLERIGGVMVVIAVTDRAKGHRGISAFLIDKGTPGFRIEREIPMLGGHRTYELVLDNCRVPAA